MGPWDLTPYKDLFSTNRHRVVKNPNPGEKVCHYYRMSHVQNPSCPGQIQEERNDAKGNCRSWCAACQLPFHDTCHFLYHSSVLKMFDLNNFVSRTYNFSHPNSRHRPVDMAHAQGLVHSTVLPDTVQGPPSMHCPASVPYQYPQPQPLQHLDSRNRTFELASVHQSPSGMYACCDPKVH